LPSPVRTTWGSESHSLSVYGRILTSGRLLLTSRGKTAIQSLDTLFPANLDRLVIHSLFEPLKLARGVDCFSFASVGVLVQDNDNFMLRFHDGSSCNNGNINNLMAVNALQINLLSCAVNDSNIITRNSSICTRVNASTSPDLTLAVGLKPNIGCAGWQHSTSHRPAQPISLLEVQNPWPWTAEGLW
jgi:hypothetical protein